MLSAEGVKRKAQGSSFSALFSFLQGQLVFLAVQERLAIIPVGNLLFITGFSVFDFNRINCKGFSGTKNFHDRVHRLGAVIEFPDEGFASLVKRLRTLQQ